MKEPTNVAMLSARMAKAFPSLSAYSCATLADELCAIERAQRRHAERCCNGSDGGYVRMIGRCSECGEDWPCSVDGNRAAYRPDVAALHGCKRVAAHDPDAEERAGERIERMTARWLVNLGSRIIMSAEVRNEQPSDQECRLRAQHVGIERSYDPRGAVLTVRLPNERQAVAL